MTKINLKRRALFTSVLALLLCCAMLVGTTFAWFTDSVATTNNVIKSGNLDVNLYYWDNSMDTGTQVAIEDNLDLKLFKNVDGEAILWEPGATGFGQFEVVNEGTLALKYQLMLNFSNASETADGKTLADVLSVYAVVRDFKTGADDVMEDAKLEELRTTYMDSTVPGYESQSLKNFVLEGYLLPGEGFKYELGAFWDPTDHDNDYNVVGGMTMDFGVTLVATQMTYEKDAYDDQYDAGATYPIATPISGTPAAPYEGDLFPTGTNVVSYKDISLVENASILIDSNAGVALQNVTADLNGSAIIMKDYNPAVYIYDCDFTLPEGAKLIDASAFNGGVYQIFLVKVTVNGELLTQESAAKYLDNVNWYQVLPEDPTM